jgi:hypothetical protein
MNDKYVLILGANSDIAKELSILFAKEGFNLYLASRDVSSLNKMKNFLEIKYPIKAEVLYFDACKVKSHKKFYNSLKIRPTGVIIAFGYLGDQIKAQKNFFEARKIIETNLLGAISILEIISEEFEKRKRGFIIGISSVAGDRGRRGNYIYGASKGGFSIYLEGLRSRLSKWKIKVLTVKPGFVNTKMTKHLCLNKKLVATPKKVAKDIYNAYKKKKKVVYTKGIWKYIMFLVKFSPINL